MPASQASAIAPGPWRPMNSAPLDRTPVVLRVKDADSLPTRAADLAGIAFVGRWGGGATGGWNFAAPVGYGGIPSDWLVGWRPVVDIEDDDADEARWQRFAAAFGVNLEPYPAGLGNPDRLRYKYQQANDLLEAWRASRASSSTDAVA